jgi:hypothetical protein
MLISFKYMLHMNLKPLIIFIRLIDIYFLKKKLYVPNCYMHELLVCEAHGGRLLRHFEVVKTLDVFHEHFY